MSTATISLGRQESVERLARRLAGADEALLGGFHAVRAFSRTIRSSEYHVTNACQHPLSRVLFFTFDFDKQTKDQTDLAALRAFIQRERARHINAALLIGASRRWSRTASWRSSRTWNTSRSHEWVFGLAARRLRTRECGHYALRRWYPGRSASGHQPNGGTFTACSTLR